MGEHKKNCCSSGNGDHRASVADRNNIEAMAELFWRHALKTRYRQPMSDIVSFNKTGTQIPLYLFPSVALGPTEYLKLGRSFSLEQPWHVLVPPMDECKAGADGLIKEIAVHFANRLHETEPEGRPIIVGGWSAGVTPALEVARLLRARGRDVPLMIAIDMAPENTGVVEGRKSMRKQIKSNIYNSRQQELNWPTTIIHLIKTILTHIYNTINQHRQDAVDKIEQGNPGISQEDIAQMRRFYAAALDGPQPSIYDGKVLVIESSHELHQRVKEKWESFATDTESIIIDGTHLSVVYWNDAQKLGNILSQRLNVLSSSYFSPRNPMPSVAGHHGHRDLQERYMISRTNERTLNLDARKYFLECPIDCLTLAQTLAAVDRAIQSRQRVQHVCVNVAKFVAMRKNKELEHDVRSSDVISADGMGIVWAARLMGIPVPERVPGVDLMGQVLELCAVKGYRPYLLGATPDVLQRSSANIQDKFPRLQFAGLQHGYFGAGDEAQVITAIRNSRADCLFIGMPTPRKERLLARYRDELNVPFIMGVGGALDVYAGHTQRAPRFVQSIGLEWLFRTLQEPMRLGPRYLTTNVAFAGILTKELVVRLLSH